MPVEDIIHQTEQTEESPFQEGNLPKHPNFSRPLIKCSIYNYEELV